MDDCKLNARNKWRRSEENKRYKVSRGKKSVPLLNNDEGIQAIIEPQVLSDQSSWCSENEENIERASSPLNLSAVDFELLLEISSSTSEYLKLNLEKDWTLDETKQLYSGKEYLSINTNLLNSGLLTIPLYKRLDYDISLFSNTELDSMNISAEKYDKLYHDMIINDDNNEKSNENFKSSEVPNELSITNNIDNACAPNISNNIEATNDKKNMEDWLDEILE